MISVWLTVLKMVCWIDQLSFPVEFHLDMWLHVSLRGLFVAVSGELDKLKFILI